MVAAPPDGRRFLKLEVMAAGEMTDTGLEIEPRRQRRHRRELELDGLDAVEELCAAMYEPGKGTWYLATITVHDNGEIKADFDYETAPFGGIHDQTPDSGHADPDLLRPWLAPTGWNCSGTKPAVATCDRRGPCPGSLPRLTTTRNVMSLDQAALWVP